MSTDKVSRATAAGVGLQYQQVLADLVRAKDALADAAVAWRWDPRKMGALSDAVDAYQRVIDRSHVLEVRIAVGERKQSHKADREASRG